MDTVPGEKQPMNELDAEVSTVGNALERPSQRWIGEEVNSDDTLLTEAVRWFVISIK